MTASRKKVPWPIWWTVRMKQRGGLIVAWGDAISNALIPVEGTPLSASAPIDPIDFIRTIAAARLMMPKSVVRLSAGRDHMSVETQALCFLAGANSIFVGDRLLTAKNPELDTDELLFSKLGIEPMPAHAG